MLGFALITLLMALETVVVKTRARGLECEKSLNLSQDFSNRRANCENAENQRSIFFVLREPR